MTDAIVYLKSGERKFGVLLSQHPIMDRFFRFVSNSNLEKYFQTNNDAYVELVENQQIEAIDINLK